MCRLSGKCSVVCEATPMPTTQGVAIIAQYCLSQLVRYVLDMVGWSLNWATRVLLASFYEFDRYLHALWCLKPCLLGWEWTRHILISPWLSSLDATILEAQPCCHGVSVSTALSPCLQVILSRVCQFAQSSTGQVMHVWEPQRDWNYG